MSAIASAFAISFLRNTSEYFSASFTELSLFIFAFAAGESSTLSSLNSFFDGVFAFFFSGYIGFAFLALVADTGFTIYDSTISKNFSPLITVSASIPHSSVNVSLSPFSTASRNAVALAILGVLTCVILEKL